MKKETRSAINFNKESYSSFIMREGKTTISFLLRLAFSTCPTNWGPFSELMDLD